MRLHKCCLTRGRHLLEIVPRLLHTVERELALVARLPRSQMLRNKELQTVNRLSSSSGGSTYPMISQRRQPFLYSSPCMEISTNNPNKEDGKYSSQY